MLLFNGIYYLMRKKKKYNDKASEDKTRYERELNEFKSESSDESSNQEKQHGIGNDTKKDIESIVNQLIPYKRDDGSWSYILSTLAKILKDTNDTKTMHEIWYSIYCKEEMEERRASFEKLKEKEVKPTNTAKTKKD